MKFIRFAAILLLTSHISIGCATINAPLIKKSVQFRRQGSAIVTNPHEIVTVWVHGTGRNPIIRKFHTSPNGLLSWSNLPKDYGLKQVGKALHEHSSEDFDLEDFYTFGWSGQLSYQARESAGQDLKSALSTLRAQHFQRHGKTPKIRLVSHSHGCNVALNMANHIRDEDTLEIEELVLLACPVQAATKKMIESKSLKKIFALYSNKDLTQVLDPQGLYPEGKKHNARLFSERTFPPQINLIQAEIKWKGVGLTHVGFVRERFGKALPSILETLKAAQNETDTYHPQAGYVINILG